RDDAVLKLAALVLAARAATTRHGCVATIGKVRVEPNGVNAIASQVIAWLDARGADEAAVHRVVTDVEGAARPHGATLTEEAWTATTRFDPQLVSRLAALL